MPAVQRGWWGGWGGCRAQVRARAGKKEGQVPGPALWVPCLLMSEQATHQPPALLIPASHLAHGAQQRLERQAELAAISKAVPLLAGDGLRPAGAAAVEDRGRVAAPGAAEVRGAAAVGWAGDAERG